jgi:phospholipase A-2-activating protein
MAAQTFLVKNELPATYLDQVVDFIHKSTNGETLGQDTSNTYVDPYTGSSRYTGTTAQSTNQGGSDPFTGMSLRPFIFFPLFALQ